MALQKTIDTDFGISGNYVKIEHFHGNGAELDISAVLFATQQARVDDKNVLKRWRVTIPTPSGTGNDLLVDLYNHLKTLPIFSGAIDV